MKSHFSHKFFPLLILFLTLTLGFGQLNAQEPKVIYIYDDLGRLMRVINENNECATYEYDAVGNLLTITRSTNCVQPPTIDSLSQDTAHTGDTACLTMAGTNFFGATVTTDNPEIQLSRVRVSETNIEICLNISPFSSLGPTRIIVTTAAGAAERAFTIDRKTVTIIQNTTIGRTDRRFEGAALTIEGPATVTIDGTHRFNSLTLRNSAVVNHSAATGTSRSKLDLTVDTTLTMDATSKIDVTGGGFLGGRQPGNPFGNRGVTIGFQAGSDLGRGGGYGGLGGGDNSNAVYGDFRDPNEPGSGGGTFGNVASNGGGLVRIVAQTMALDGMIRADGGDVVTGGTTGAGSGGGIRIDVESLSGAGRITANGGTGGGVGGAGGSGGRVAIYYQNAVGFDFNKATAFGGAGGGGGPNGGAGTIYLQGPGRESGELVADNNNLLVVPLSTPVVPSLSGLLNLTNLRVSRGAKVRVDDEINLTSTLEVSFGAELTLAKRVIVLTASVTNSSVITHLPTTATALFKVDLSADTLNVDATSRIDVTGRGFLGGFQSGNPFGRDGMTVAFERGSTGRSGGSYGGLGGASDGTPNPVYGDFLDPNEPGSGGGVHPNVGSHAGNGGGLIRIVAQTMQLDGSIVANGGDAELDTGGGSGGGVRIDVGTLGGTGQITANGGRGERGGGGGGGRVATYYQDATGFNLTKVTAFGGVGISGGSNGGAGTIYLQGPGREVGEVVVDNNNLAVPSLSTPIINPPSGTISLAHLRVRRAARVRIDSLLNLTGTLEVAFGGEFISTNRTIADTVDLNNSGLITHLPTTDSAFFKVDLSADTLTIDATSRIDVMGRGFLGGFQSGNPFGRDGMTVAFERGSTGRSGGSYGGLGGASDGTSNPVYGDFLDPNEPGSGGGVHPNVGSHAGNGGGLIRIVAQTMQLDGSIVANGGDAELDTGGGSGGGIRVDVGTLRGTGQITANGGVGQRGGGGGGGRVATYYQDAAGFDLTKVTSFGGIDPGGHPSGQDGTVHLQQQTFILWAPMDSEIPTMTADVHENKALQFASLPTAF